MWEGTNFPHCRTQLRWKIIPQFISYDPNFLNALCSSCPSQRALNHEGPNTVRPLILLIGSKNGSCAKNSPQCKYIGLVQILIYPSRPYFTHGVVLWNDLAAVIYTTVGKKGLHTKKLGRLVVVSFNINISCLSSPPPFKSRQGTPLLLSQ